MSSTATDLRVSTKSMPMEERIGKLEREMLRYGQDLREIKEFMATMATNFDAFTVRHKDPQEANSYSIIAASTQQGGLQARFIRFDFPKFSGEDPTGWIYRAEQFFKYQGTGDGERVLLASFHLQEKALQWFQWYEGTHPHLGWQEFTQTLCVRFRPSEYEGFDEALAKLPQIRTVREYQVNFEKLAMRVQGCPEKVLVGSFIGGLKEKIHVKLSKSITVLATVGLACKQEEKLQKQRRVFKPPPPYKTANPIATPRMMTGVVPFKKLAWVEIQARREKGLCNNSDKKFTSGHHCKVQQIFLLETSIDEDNDQEDEPDGEVDPSTEAPKISLQALSGLASPRTIRVVRIVRGR